MNFLNYFNKRTILASSYELNGNYNLYFISVYTSYRFINIINISSFNGLVKCGNELLSQKTIFATIMRIVNTFQSLPKLLYKQIKLLHIVLELKDKFYTYYHIQK